MLKILRPISVLKRGGVDVSLKEEEIDVSWKDVLVVLKIRKTNKCKKHGGGNRCIIEGCPNSAEDSKTNMCSKHGGGNRCIVEGCPRSAVDSKTNKCIKHGGGNRCIIEGCPNSAQDQ